LALADIWKLPLAMSAVIAREFDLGSKQAWRVLARKYPAAAQVDVARFTFELDAHGVEVQALVDSILAGRTG
jgi:hypothetical protein